MIADSPKESDPSDLTVGEIAKMISKARQTGYQNGLVDAAMAVGIGLEGLEFKIKQLKFDGIERRGPYGE